MPETIFTENRIKSMEAPQDFINGAFTLSLPNKSGIFAMTNDLPVRYFIRADSTRTLPNNGNENAIFNSPANGRLTIPTGTYIFNGMIALDTMSATSGNCAIDIKGAGTATCGAWLWNGQGRDAGVTGVGAVSGGSINTQQSATNIVTASTLTEMYVNITGTFEVTVAGTIIPSITLTTANAAVIKIGSYITFEKIGEASVISSGAWD